MSLSEKNPETEIETSESGGQGVSANKLFTSPDGKRKFKQMLDLEKKLRDGDMVSVEEHLKAAHALCPSENRAIKDQLALTLAMVTDAINNKVMHP